MPRADGGAGRDRSARDLAAVRRALSPVPRHAVAAVARPGLRRGVRPRRARSIRPNADHYLRRDRRGAGRPTRSGRARCSSASTSRCSPRPRAPLDDARASRRRSATAGWKGRVVTAYRPDPVVDPEHEGFARQSRSASASMTGEDTSTLGRLSRRRTASAAPSSALRRHLDRPRPSDRRAPPTCRRPRPRRCSPGCSTGDADAGDAELFRARC